MLGETNSCLSGIDTVGLLQAVAMAVEMVRDEVGGGAIPVPDYEDVNVSERWSSSSKATWVW